MKTLLTIAGFDPSSGAGITADLAVMTAHRFFGTACITALTVQSTRGVQSWRPNGAALVRETLAYLQEDLPPAGIKIGMLADGETARAVAAFLEELPASIPIVLDPVVRSSSGRKLLEPGGIAILADRLLPRVGWITPNLAELALLTGQPVQSAPEIEQAVAALQGRYPALAVVATGGHLPEPDDFVAESGRPAAWLKGERVETRATHGTGCAFSTALLCGLVQGLTGEEAAAQAKAYVGEAMRRAEPRGAGRGPMALSWPCC